MPSIGAAEAGFVRIGILGKPSLIYESLRIPSPQAECDGASDEQVKYSLHRDRLVSPQNGCTQLVIGMPLIDRARTDHASSVLLISYVHVPVAPPKRVPTLRGDSELIS